MAPHDFSSFSSGILSGIATRVVIEPFDVIKIRMQLTDSEKPANIFKMMQKIYANEGILIRVF